MSYLEVNIRWKIKGKLNSRKSKRITDKLGTNYTLWYSKLKNDFILLLAAKVHGIIHSKMFCKRHDHWDISRILNREVQNNRNRKENQMCYFSLVGCMKYIASIVGNGCLRLYMSSTTTKKAPNYQTIKEIELKKGCPINEDAPHFDVKRASETST